MYFALALAITRMRAELGTPIHDLHFTGPETIMTRVAGSRAFNADNLTVFALFFWFNRAYRSHPMPHQLEAYKLAEQSRTQLPQVERRDFLVWARWPFSSRSGPFCT